MSNAEEPRINIEHREPIAPRPLRQEPSKTYTKQILIVTGGFFAVVAIGFAMDTSADFLRRQFSGWSTSAFASDDVPACSDPSVTEVITDGFSSQMRQIIRSLPSQYAKWEIKLSNIQEEFYNKLAKSRRCSADVRHINAPDKFLLLALQC